MIKVTIELESSITGETTILGRMMIWNSGATTDPAKGDYTVAVLRKGRHKQAFGRIVPWSPDILRSGEVKSYPRLSYNVWRLIVRALKSAFPEEA